MTMRHPYSSRPRLKPAGACALLLLLAGGAWIAARQHAHLADLRSRLASARAALPGSSHHPEAPSSKSPSRSDSATEPVLQPLSHDGEELLEEAGALLEKLRPLLEGKNFSEITSINDNPDLERLQLALIRMGGLTFLKLLEQHPDIPSPDEWQIAALRSYYLELNPRQSLQLALASSPGGIRNLEIVCSFESWKKIDPDSACRWFMQMQREQNPVAGLKDLKGLAVELEASRHPAAAVSDMLENYRASGSQVGACGLPNILGSLHGAAQISSFLTALNEAAPSASENQDVHRLATSLAGAYLSTMPFDEAAPVVASTFNEAEKKYFTTQLASPRVDPAEWPKWVEWTTTLSLPPDQTHPVVAMAQCAASLPSSYGEAASFDSLQPGPLRDLALTEYVKSACERNPLAASRWVSHLPEGEPRQQLTNRIADRLQSIDPAASAALRASLGH